MKEEITYCKKGDIFYYAPFVVFLNLMAPQVLRFKATPLHPLNRQYKYNN
jgi:hypothetical protein